MTINYIEITSAIFAFLAAVLWLASALVKTPNEFTVQVISWHIHDAEAVGGATKSVPVLDFHDG
jgi:hypothetical protein